MLHTFYTMRAWAIALVNALAFGQEATALPSHRNTITESQVGLAGTFYHLGSVTYFANSKRPYRVLSVSAQLATDGLLPLTTIVVNQSQVTGDFLNATISAYLAHDDVFSVDFLANIYLSASSGAVIDPTAVEYLETLDVNRIFVDTTVFQSVPASFIHVHYEAATTVASGPYTAVISDTTLTLLTTYRLYADEYRDFITGIYPSNEGTDSFIPLQSTSSSMQAPMIPVPSRIHSWNDTRPLAGVRVAVKDLFDIHGLQTSAGSHAWTLVTPIANSTAPAIQRLVDLGAVLVGKFKLAQFASASDAWEWIDEQYPFNPRGDGYLTCSASSSGGGCAVAAYDWLDASIGTDTGSSMRRPAAVSGTFGNRPSQGMISLEGAVSLNWAQDTAGVFSRDPVAWSRFAKAWYTPELHQNVAVTGLSPLNVPDTMKFPTRILYPDDYFPMQNPAAQGIADAFIAKMSTLFGMTVQRFNFTATVSNATIYPNIDPWDGLFYASSMTTTWAQYVDVSGPLMSKYKTRYGGRFPPVESVWRTTWSQLNLSALSQSAYDQALKDKARAVDWFESIVLYETLESCSESLMLCDIGTGGLPSFREKGLNDGPNATYLNVVPDGLVVSCATICPLFGYVLVWMLR
jgi:Asp-tRNA(Asn)/Glu-tRNA(Gln) amidotransferase A subunit family amidase